MPQTDAQRRYNDSEKGRASRRRYRQSPKGKEAHRQSAQRAYEKERAMKEEGRIHMIEQQRIHGNHVRHVQAKQAGEPEYGHVTSDGTIEVRRV